MSVLVCPIRREKVAATPEEKVRQAVLQELVQNLGFPFEAIAVEKGLKQMPHVALMKGKIPLRRADIVVFAKGIHPAFSLYPLLLIECKAVRLTSAVIRQVVGYNHYLQARFVAVVNAEERKTGWYDAQKREYVFTDRFLDYQELTQPMQQV